MTNIISLANESHFYIEIWVSLQSFWPVSTENKSSVEPDF
jgi:hypothetical protein